MQEDDNSYGRRFTETVTVAAVLVLPGDPEPTEWLSRHPGALRLPVRLVQTDRDVPLGRQSGTVA
jgi:hypothetical protein